MTRDITVLSVPTRPTARVTLTVSTGTALLSGTGQQATGAVAGAGQNYANQAGAATMQGGEAMAAGQIGYANAIIQGKQARQQANQQNFNNLPQYRRGRRRGDVMPNVPYTQNAGVRQAQGGAMGAAQSFLAGSAIGKEFKGMRVERAREAKASGVPGYVRRERTGQEETESVDNETCRGIRTH